MIIQKPMKKNEQHLHMILLVIGTISLVLLLLSRTLASTSPLTKPKTEDEKPSARMYWLQPVSLTQSSLISLSRVILPGHAIGQLVFINDGPADITIQSLILRSKSGVKVTFTGPITVPALDPTILVTGFSIVAGPAGVLPQQLALVQVCCQGNMVVKNATAFTLEQSPLPNDLLTQQDIDNTSQPLIKALKQEALTTLAGQVKDNGHVAADSVQCHSVVQANHRVGDVTQTVTVTVKVTCSGEAQQAVS